MMFAKPGHLLHSVTLAAGLAFSVTVTAGCDVQLEPAYPAGTYGDYPSDAFIATTDPWYFDGRASYWYGGRWYYRDGRAWGHYANEPAALRQRRLQGAPRRHLYEQPAGHTSARGGGARGGRSGGRR